MFLLIFRYVFGGAINTGARPLRRLPRSRLRPHRRAVLGIERGVGRRRGPRSRLHRPAAFTADPAQQRDGRPRARRHGDARRGVSSITTAIGFAVGLPPAHGASRHALAAFGLCIVAAYAFSWVFIFIGLVSGTAQAAQGISLLVFPLTFVSSGYVPVASMPGWMQPFAEHQPITVMVDAVRSLVLGADTRAATSRTRPATTWSATFSWAAAISLVFGTALDPALPQGLGSAAVMSGVPRATGVTSPGARHCPDQLFWCFGFRSICRGPRPSLTCFPFGDAEDRPPTRRTG